MLVLNGFFKDNAVIPDTPLIIPDGAKAVISIEEASQSGRKPIYKKKRGMSFLKGFAL